MNEDGHALFPIVDVHTAFSRARPPAADELLRIGIEIGRDDFIERLVGGETLVLRLPEPVAIEDVRTCRSFGDQTKIVIAVEIDIDQFSDSISKSTKFV